MANLSAAIQRIRRSRSNLDTRPPQNFERYREIYWTVLAETADLAGDEAFDELTAWMLETTASEEQLPRPEDVRQKAREICAAHGVSVPRNSPLRD